jgi:integrase
MSVAVRPWKKPGKFQVDIIFRKPDGIRVRDQRVVEAKSEGTARRWGEAREAQLRSGTLILEARPVMTVADFAPLFVSGHLEGNAKKRSAIVAVESILNIHVLPFIGSKPLDRVSDDVVADLRSKWLSGGYEIPSGLRKGMPVTFASKKSVNNRLAALGSMLRRAVEWRSKTGLVTLPCSIKLLPVDDQKLPAFYDHETYERMVDAADKISPEALAIVLLGGDAGLRLGEILGLDQADVDRRGGRLTPRRSVFVKGKDRHEDDVKGGLAKPVPMSSRLADALKALRHLKGSRVFYGREGDEMTPKALRGIMARVETLAGLPAAGHLHVLRHTFCSHLAMAGVPAMTIKDLARHSSLSTTLRYMHLSPSAKDDGIAMLAASRAAGGAVVQAPSRARPV